MRDYISIGSAPCDEPVEQANVEGSNYNRMRAECDAFRAQIRRVLGKEPEGAQLSVKFFPDGNYGYYEVVCYYDSHTPDSINYAFRCEREAPAEWDAEARRDLAGVATGVQA